MWGDGGNADGLDVLLGRVATSTVNEVKGTNRVVYGRPVLCVRFP